MSTNKVATARFGKEADESAPEVLHQHWIKRLMFVASLYFKLIGVKDPSEKQREELNQRFRLSHRKGALMFPAALSNVMWKDVNLSELATKYRNGELPANRLADVVLGVAPAWCRYGDGSSIRQDIKAVFDCVK